jgi:hypothetical protein
VTAVDRCHVDHQSAKHDDALWSSMLPGRTAELDFEDGSPIEIHEGRTCAHCKTSITRIGYRP